MKETKMLDQNTIISRDSYLDNLKSHQDKQIIKVLTGIRRSGKSTLLYIFRDYLKKSGIAEEQIHYVNLDAPESSSLLNFLDLYQYIKDRLIDDKMNYVFIDEVQMCNEFQRAVVGLFNKENVDLYISGSNSYILSGELATLLSGRYVALEVLPLSFSEYLAGSNETDKMKAFQTFFRFGGFPLTLKYNGNELAIDEYLEGVYNTIIRKDVELRYKIQDSSILEDVIRFMFDNVGNISSAKKISDTLTSNGRKISHPTVEQYLKALCDCFILYRVDRYDIKGKQYLSSLSKYYVADLGLKNYLLRYSGTDFGHSLENIVYLELKRRRYKVYIGKVEKSEIDFIATNYKETIYIQVADNIRDPNTLERELSPLRAAKDFNRRILIINDYHLNNSYDGIEVINIIDFLLKQ